MENEDIIVSISCITYNHVRYIRQCLDGFLMQKADFAYEVLIHYDCSTDGTTEIIREYEVKYPNIIKPIYESENQYQSGKPSGSAVWNYPRARGKYIALCEGDDFWIDPYKLQTQVDFLEANEDCSLVISDGFYFSDSEKELKRINPIDYESDAFVSFHDLVFEKNFLIPTASMMFRAKYAYMPDFCLSAPVGDKPLRMWCALNGRVYYFAKEQVAYRIGSVSSFGKKVSRDSDYAKKIYERMESFYKAFDDYSNYIFHDDILMLLDKEAYMLYQRIRDYKTMSMTKYFKRLPFISKFKYFIKRIIRYNIV